MWITQQRQPHRQHEPRGWGVPGGSPQEWEGITESQNHRMVGVERDLCGSSSPPLLPKQGHLQQAAQDLVQAGIAVLKGGPG